MATTLNSTAFVGQISFSDWISERFLLSSRHQRFVSYLKARLHWNLACNLTETGLCPTGEILKQSTGGGLNLSPQQRELTLRCRGAKVRRGRHFKHARMHTYGWEKTTPLSVRLWTSLGLVLILRRNPTWDRESVSLVIPAPSFMSFNKQAGIRRLSQQDLGTAACENRASSASKSLINANVSSRFQDLMNFFKFNLAAVCEKLVRCIAKILPYYSYCGIYNVYRILCKIFKWSECIKYWIIYRGRYAKYCNAVDFAMWTRN